MGIRVGVGAPYPFPTPPLALTLEEVLVTRQVSAKGVSSGTWSAIERSAT